jgi:hypothetical protein
MTIFAWAFRRSRSLLSSRAAIYADAVAVARRQAVIRP